jgi:hypothetical protein
VILSSEVKSKISSTTKGEVNFTKSSARYSLAKRPSKVTPDKLPTFSIPKPLLENLEGLPGMLLGPIYKPHSLPNLIGEEWVLLAYYISLNNLNGYCGDIK